MECAHTTDQNEKEKAVYENIPRFNMTSWNNLIKVPKYQPEEYKCRAQVMVKADGEEGKRHELASVQADLMLETHLNVDNALNGCNGSIP